MKVKKYTSFIKKIPYEQRTTFIDEISGSASPGFDFYLLVILSSSIATLGLITNSPAVIIGAMLIAPLMSPIIGIGLASVIGKNDLLRKSMSALTRGAIFAIGLSAFLTFINLYMPFVSFQELSSEIVSRTHPSPLDLIVALAGGLAAAYSMTEPKLSAALPGVAIATALMPPLSTIGIGLALGKFDVAGGAFLLFVTNAITIAFASALVFFMRGLYPFSNGKNKFIPTSLQFSAFLIIILLIPLSYFSVQFVRQATETRTINDSVHKNVALIENAELVDLQVNMVGDSIDLDLTIRTNVPLNYEQVIKLQENIVADLSRPVSIRVNQVFAERLDPLIPPTATFTPTLTNTATPGPSPTFTFTPTITSTLTSTPTITSSPTSTLTSTPTSSLGRAWITPIPIMRIYQYPGGPVVGLLSQNQVITILPEEVVFENLIWVKIVDQENRSGWVPKVYVNIFTATPTLVPEE